MASKTKSDTNSKASSAKQAKPLNVEMINGRAAHLGWVLFGGLAGSLLLLRLGILGKIVGLCLLLAALEQSVKLLRSYRHAPGTFRVQGDAVQIPTGLCQREVLDLPLASIEHVFFLRKQVPWTQAGPILVIEAEGKSYRFPRDWFASDSDQRRVESALVASRQVDRRS